MEDILIFICVVFGILNLILFFKIWGMTDKVKHIDSLLSKQAGWGQGYNQVLYSHRVNGNIQKGLEMLNDSFMKELANTRKTSEEEFTLDRDRLINIYTPYYKVIGKEIPNDFSEMTLETAKWIFR